MLEIIAIRGFELTKDPLEACSWTINIAVGGIEQAIGITKVELTL